MTKRTLILAGSLLILLLAACAGASNPEPVAIGNEANINSEPALALVENTPAPEATAVRLVLVEEDNSEDKALSADETSALPSQSETDESVVSKADLNLNDVGDGAILIYKRTSGKMGIGPTFFEWRFYADGRVAVSDGRVYQITPEEVKNLVDSMTAQGFFALEVDYTPEDTCCDRAAHEISVQQDGRVYQVTTLDGANNPPELDIALQSINNVLSALAEQGQ
ncbi:MAG: hypothetical protein GY796_19105 [Chloroflexi bacterium]|nr:hypothetical protein [Chloroflexota bacterium]